MQLTASLLGLRILARCSSSVDLTEHKWGILGERRGLVKAISKSPKTSNRYMTAITAHSASQRLVKTSATPFQIEGGLTVVTDDALYTQLVSGRLIVWKPTSYSRAIVPGNSRQRLQLP